MRFTRTREALAGAGLMLALSLGCQGARPAPSGPGSPGNSAQPAPPQAVIATPRPLEQAAGSQATSRPATAAPSVATTPTAPAEPAGRVVYAIPDSIAPAYFDPQEYTLATVPYIFGNLIHDALLKHAPGQPYKPSLAESYEIAPDFKGATFTIRANAKFHNDAPITAEDVKFTFENYRGANAKALKEKVEAIETPDARTVRFVFKQPFLDFLTLYGSAASGAGWIVPKAYYQEVGPDGFKKAPVGAGPYRVVRQVPGSELEVEAHAGYAGNPPNVKTIVVKSIPDAATRVAAAQTGEVDFAQQVPSQLVDAVKNDPALTLVTSFGSSITFLEFPGFEKPDNPFSDRRVREAVSLALDRPALSDAETAGLAPPAGNWIPEDWPSAIKVPPPARDLARAKQLLAEAGYPDGLDADTITPLAPQYASIAERVLTQLREVGIRARINSMDIAATYAALLKNQTPDRLKGIVLELPGGAGDAAGRVDVSMTCQGARSPKCVPEIEERFSRYKASTDPEERERLLAEIQRFVADNAIVVPIYRNVFFHAQGPRVANAPGELWGAIPQFTFLGPYESIRLKGG